ncbi:hypothetical protein P856_114 [Candidatus Endolissoclinum faulkneri L5]|uniref:Uncharacterized protein n=2 Tax=Candidatus Endolissoclinum faulkneri TaxID=1263979 RepID=V9TT74_9PROT|nr:hypothetical protein P856_114 [Candidatus Endolissoclinum faulkneri L5]
MLRGASGFIVTGVPLMMIPLTTILEIIFGSLAMLFGLYLIRTYLRAYQVIEIEDKVIRRTGYMDTEIPWEKLDTMKLHYFSTRYNKNSGYLELKIAGNGKELYLDNSINDFNAIVSYCNLVARRNNICLSKVTTDNLKAIGLIKIAQNINDNVR